MAYKINRSDEVIVSDAPATARELKRLLKLQKTPEFYELELQK